jgi:hypothetical protein
VPVLVAIVLGCHGASSGNRCVGNPDGSEHIITFCEGKLSVTCVPTTSISYDEHDEQCTDACGPFLQPLNAVLPPIYGCLHSCTEDAQCSPRYPSCYQGFCSGYNADYSPCYDTCKPSSSCRPSDRSMQGDAGTGDSGAASCCWPTGQPGPVTC